MHLHSNTLTTILYKISFFSSQRGFQEMGFEGNEITLHLLVWFSYRKGLLLREQMKVQ